MLMKQLMMSILMGFLFLSCSEPEKIKVIHNSKALFDKSCKLLDTTEEQNDSSKECLKEYNSTYLSYPKEAEEKQIEGVVYIEFIISKKRNDGGFKYSQNEQQYYFRLPFS